MASKLEDVKAVVVSTLGIENRARELDAGTPLFGHLPELDSMSVLELVAVIEQRFNVRIEDEEITGETFETLGSLAAFVEHKLECGAVRG